MRRCLITHKHHHGNNPFVRVGMRSKIRGTGQKLELEQVPHRSSRMANFRHQSEGVGGSGGWLVILNKSLAESELHHLLSSQKYRVRGECMCMLNNNNNYLWVVLPLGNILPKFTLDSTYGSGFTLCIFRQTVWIIMLAFNQILRSRILTWNVVTCLAKPAHHSVVWKSIKPSNCIWKIRLGSWCKPAPHSRQGLHVSIYSRNECFPLSFHCHNADHKGPRHKLSTFWY